MSLSGIGAGSGALKAHPPDIWSLFQIDPLAAIAVSDVEQISQRPWIVIRHHFNGAAGLEPIEQLENDCMALTRRELPRIHDSFRDSVGLRYSSAGDLRDLRL